MAAVVLHLFFCFLVLTKWGEQNEMTGCFVLLSLLPWTESTFFGKSQPLLESSASALSWMAISKKKPRAGPSNSARMPRWIVLVSWSSVKARWWWHKELRESEFCAVATVQTQLLAGAEDNSHQHCMYTVATILYLFIAFDYLGLGYKAVLAASF
jgi:hypothetical protein